MGRKGWCERSATLGSILIYHRCLDQLWRWPATNLVRMSFQYGKMRDLGPLGFFTHELRRLARLPKKGSCTLPASLWSWSGKIGLSVLFLHFTIRTEDNRQCFEEVQVNLLCLRSSNQQSVLASKPPSIPSKPQTTCIYACTYNDMCPNFVSLRSQSELLTPAAARTRRTISRLPLTLLKAKKTTVYYRTGTM